MPRLLLLSLLLTGCLVDSKPQEEPYVPDIEPLPAIATNEADDGVDVYNFVKHYLTAKLSELSGDRATAAMGYRDAHQAYPDNTFVKEQAFHLQLATGGWSDAVQTARVIAASDETLPLSYIVLGVQAISQKAYPEARRFFEQAQALSPQLIHLHLILGYLDLAMGTPLTAVTREVRELPYDRFLAAVKHYHLGLMLRYGNDLEQALVEFNLAYERDGTSLFTLAALTDTLEQLNRRDEAAVIFTSFFDNQPKNLMARRTYDQFLNNQTYFPDVVSINHSISEVLFNLATVMNVRYAPFSAHQILTIAAQLSDTPELMTFYRGLLYEQEEMLTQARDIYQSLPKESDVYLAGRVRLASTLQALEMHHDAIAVMSDIVENYDFLFIKRILAEMYFSAEKYDHARKLYDRIIAEIDEPQSSDAWLYFARGSSHERLKNYDMAEQDLTTSLDLKPDNATALNYLGYMLVDMDSDIERGKKLIARALLLEPNDPAILDSMGWAWYKLGDYEKALVFLEKAASQLADDPTINMHLGDVYYKLGRLEEAVLHWQRALAAEPDNPRDIAHLKQRLGIH